MSKRTEKAAHESQEYRRKVPCVNHHKVVAVTRCEVCGNPICRECIKYYEGALICSAECLVKKTSEQEGRISADDRHQRKVREQKLDRAVTIGLWSALGLVLAAVGIFVYLKMTDQSGEKIWEFKKAGGYFRYWVKPGINTLFLLSDEGTLDAVDSLTGVPSWSAKFKKGKGSGRALVIDAARCLVYFSDTVLLCQEEHGDPVWKFDVPKPPLSATPAFLNERVYLASCPSDLSYESFDYLSWQSSPPEKEGDEGEYSVVTAVDMSSGQELWSIELKDIRISALLAADHGLYAVGYKFSDYSRYRYLRSRERTPLSEEGDADEKEELPSQLHLWALDLASGEPKWRIEGTGDFAAAPRTTERGIVFSTTQNVYLISQDGTSKWKYPLMDKLVYAIEPSATDLFVSTDDGFLNCIDLDSGKWKWMSHVGTGAFKIVPSPPLVFVSGWVKKHHDEEDEMQFTATKRAQGVEDLLEETMRPFDDTYERVLYGINIESGEKLWSVPKITGDFQFAQGRLYALRYFEWMQLLDATVDPSQLAKRVSNLGAYDPLTGERVWESGIEGHVSDLALTDYAAIVTAREELFSIAGGQQPREVRLIGISLR